MFEESISMDDLSRASSGPLVLNPNGDNVRRIKKAGVFFQLPTAITIYLFYVLVVFQVAKMMLTGAIIVTELEHEGCHGGDCDSLSHDSEHGILVLQCLYSFALTVFIMCIGCVTFLHYETTSLRSLEIKLKYLGGILVLQMIGFAIGVILMHDLNAFITVFAVTVMIAEGIAVCLSFFLRDIIGPYQTSLATNSAAIGDVEEGTTF
ncbi:hypothetical protein Ocin01_15028, partial [Orchesella cincta]